MQPIRCSQCHIPLQVGMWECPNCRLMFPAPVPRPPKRKLPTWALTLLFLLAGSILFFSVGLYAQQSRRDATEVGTPSAEEDLSVSYGRTMDGVCHWLSVNTNIHGSTELLQEREVVAELGLPNQFDDNDVVEYNCRDGRVFISYDTQTHVDYVGGGATQTSAILYAYYWQKVPDPPAPKIASSKSMTMADFSSRVRVGESTSEVVSEFGNPALYTGNMTTSEFYMVFRCSDGDVKVSLDQQNAVTGAMQGPRASFDQTMP